MTTSMIYPMANGVNLRLTEAVGYEDERILELADSMQLYDNEKIRIDEEGEVLNFGDRVTMKRRVVHYQVKGVVTGVHVNVFDGTIKYDVTPDQGQPHHGISKFELVKSSDGRHATKTQEI